MSELVKLVAKRADITTAKAKKAVAAVTEYLQEKLPEPVAGVIVTLLGEGEGVLGQAGSLLEGLGGAGGLGGLLGGLLGGQPPAAPKPEGAAPKPKPKPKPEAESPKPKPKPKPKPPAPGHSRPKPKPRPKKTAGE